MKKLALFAALALILILAGVASADGSASLIIPDDGNESTSGPLELEGPFPGDTRRVPRTLPYRSYPHDNEVECPPKVADDGIVFIPYCNLK